MKRIVAAGSITSFFPVLGQKSKKACPEEGTSSSQEDQDQADHDKSLSDSAAPDDGTSNSKSSKHKQGQYDLDWERQYTWFIQRVMGKECFTLCQRFNTCNERNSSTIFNLLPCVSLRRAVLARHADSLMHKSAVLQEHERLAFQQNGGIVHAFSEAISMERKSIVGAMKCLYWLAKHEIAHTTKYVPLLELVQDLGCSYFDNLRVGGNATYTSERIVQEFILHMGSQVERGVVQQLLSSPFVSLLCDETTDISVLKQMIVYGKYLTDSGDTRTVSLKITDLLDGKAETIERALLQFCEATEISIRKVMGFGSDGAAVMIGNNRSFNTFESTQSVYDQHPLCCTPSCLGCCSIIRVHPVSQEVQERHPQPVHVLSQQSSLNDWTSYNSRCSW